jgi:hypothetical protein
MTSKAYPSTDKPFSLAAANVGDQAGKIPLKLARLYQSFI